METENRQLRAEKDEALQENECVLQEKNLDKLHLNSEGHVVEPFVAMTDTDARKKRAQEWYEMLALDLEEECLIK